MTVLEEYETTIRHYLGPVDTGHLANLHALGYLPLVIKAIPEGRAVPLRVPLLTIQNTEDQFPWLTNMIESLLSCILWKPITAATIAGVVVLSHAHVSP